MKNTMKVKYLGPGKKDESPLFTLGKVYDAQPWEGAESKEEREAYVTVFCDKDFLCVRPLFGKATEANAEYFQKVSEKPLWETIDPKRVLSALKEAVKLGSKRKTTTVDVALLLACIELMEDGE